MGNVDLVLISPIGIIIIVSVALEVHGLTMVQLAVTMCHVLQDMVHVVEDVVNAVQDIILVVVQAQFVPPVPQEHMWNMLAPLDVDHVPAILGQVMDTLIVTVHPIVLQDIITCMILI